MSGFFPATAILTGWYTRNRKAAVSVGMLPFPLMMFVGLLIFRGFAITEGWLSDAVIWHGGLAITGGLVGLFASEGNSRDLVLSIGFAMFWIFLFLSGIR